MVLLIVQPTSVTSQTAPSCDEPVPSDARPEPCLYDIPRHGRHHATPSQPCNESIGPRFNPNAVHEPGRNASPGRAAKATQEELIIILTRVIVSGRLIDLMI